MSTLDYYRADIRAAKPIFTPVTSVFLQPTCGQFTAGDGGEYEGCKKRCPGMLQHEAVNNSLTQEVPPIVHEVLRSPGQPLDAATRTFMGPRFGHDFSHVRLHTDAKATESARAVNALAYTVGRDVVFGDGQYLPETSEGRKLIAHELAHVVQQSSASNNLQRQLSVGKADTPMEAQADEVAEKVIGESESEFEGFLDIERVARTILPTGVQLQRRCRKTPPADRINADVDFAIPATPTPNRAHNTAWISARANDPSGRTAGLTELSVRMRWRYQTGRHGNQRWISRFVANFTRASIRIYLTNEFRVGSCEYNDLLRHERQHDTDYRANAAEAETHVCDNATTWPSRSDPWQGLTNADIRTLIDEWMAFENWQLDYDNWYDGCVWDTVDYPRMYTACPGVVPAQPQANCGPSPQRPVQHGLPLPQRVP